MKFRIAVVAALMLAASPAAAADKTHQQMMAEIRMLQEQQQQLQAMLGGLADTLKALTSKIDDQNAAARKSFADQKLLVDGLSENVRILREKADDTNVRLSTMAHELQVMRDAMAAMPAAPAAPVGVPGETPPGGGGLPTGAPVQQPAPATGVAPTKAWDSAWNDYTSGQYDLAIEGFEFYIKSFPTGPQADDAQLNICNSYYAMGRYKEAADACQKVIANYRQTDSVPPAYYKLGLSYEGLKQLELARRAYETLIKEYPTAVGDAALAKQRLDALTKKEN